MSRRQSLRTIRFLAEQHGLVFDGYTGKSHLRWRHKPSGRAVITVSALVGRHAIGNTVANIKQQLRQIGVTNGQHAGSN